jgi:hypothetical protein
LTPPPDSHTPANPTEQGSADPWYVEGYHPYGLNITDLSKIQLDTQEGRYQYLTSLVENVTAVNTEHQKAIADQDFDVVRQETSYFSNKPDWEIQDEVAGTLDTAKLQQSILENLDFSHSTVIQALQRKFDEYAKKSATEGMSPEASFKFYRMSRAADQLRARLVDEVRDRKQGKQA